MLPYVPTCSYLFNKCKYGALAYIRDSTPCVYYQAKWYYSTMEKLLNYVNVCYQSILEELMFCIVQIYISDHD